MNECWVYRISALVCLFRMISGDDDDNFHYYTVDQPCGYEIELFSMFDTSVFAGEVRIRWYRTPFMQSDKQPCYLYIKDFHLYDRLAVQFTYTNFDNNDCIIPQQMSRITYYSDGMSDLEGMEYERELCGKDITKPRIYTTLERNDFALQFYVPFTGHKSLTLIFNVFHTNGEDECEYGYFCDNGRCIPDDIECNPNNPCGDNSACRGLSGWEIFGIVVGSIAGFTLFCYCCCCRKRNSGSRGSGTTSNNAATSQEEGIPLNDGQPVLQTVEPSSPQPNRGSNPTPAVPVYVYVTATGQGGSNSPPSYSMVNNPGAQDMPAADFYTVRYSPSTGAPGLHVYNSGQETAATDRPHSATPQDPLPPPSYSDVMAHGDKYKVT